MSVLLLTGRPGSGKTTALRRAAELLRGYALSGFYTEEMRSATGSRVGFLGVTFGGESVVIADVRRPGSPRIGRYGVDVEAIDRLTQTTLRPEHEPDLYLVDEIGKMECLSEEFVAAMRRILESDVPLIATVALRGSGFIAAVKRHPKAELFALVPRERDRLPEKIARWAAAATRPRSR